MIGRMYLRRNSIDPTFDRIEQLTEGEVWVTCAEIHQSPQGYAVYLPSDDVVISELSNFETSQEAFEEYQRASRQKD